MVSELLAQTKMLFVALILLSSSAEGDIYCPRKSILDLRGRAEFLDNYDDITFRVLLSNIDPQTNAIKTRSLGTATLVSEEGYLLTSRHPFEIEEQTVRKQLLNGKARLYIESHDAESNSWHNYEVKLVEFPEKSTQDIAFLQTVNGAPLQRSPPFLLNFKDDPRYFESRVLGFPLDKNMPSLIETVEFHHKRDGLMKIAGPLYHGFSGALIVNSFGYGYGVLSGRSLLGDQLENWLTVDEDENKILNAVPLEAVIPWLSNLSFKNADLIVAELEKPTSISETERTKVLNQALKYENLAGLKIAEALMKLGPDHLIEAGKGYYDYVMFLTCLRGQKYVSDMFAKAASHQESSMRFSRWATDIARYALDKARGSFLKYEKTQGVDDIAESISYFELYDTVGTLADDAKNLNYRSNALWDYGKALLTAEENGLTTNPETGSGDLLARAIALAPESHRWSEVSSILSGKKAYEAARIAIAQAIHSAPYAEKLPLISDWTYILNQEIATELDEEKLSVLRHIKTSATTNAQVRVRLVDDSVIEIEGLPRNVVPTTLRKNRNVCDIRPIENSVGTYSCESPILMKLHEPTRALAAGVNIDAIEIPTEAEQENALRSLMMTEER